MTPKQTEEDMLGGHFCDIWLFWRNIKERSHHNYFTPCSVSDHQQTVND